MNILTEYLQIFFTLKRRDICTCYKKIFRADKTVLKIVDIKFLYKIPEALSRTTGDLRIATLRKYYILRIHKAYL